MRRAFRIAALSVRGQDSVPPIDELLDIAYTRRRFLRDSAIATAAVAGATLVGGCSGPATAPAPTTGGDARIAIVGGGMAGLNAAYKLRKVGLRAKIFEGSGRTGGRMFTAKDLLGDGLTTELGGEFIDSTHEEMLALMEEFGLEKLDTWAPEAASPKS